MGAENPVQIRAPCYEVVGNARWTSAHEMLPGAPKTQSLGNPHQC
jgi:hypothetical protein